MEIRKDVDLSKLTTLKVGGKASFFVEVYSLDELKEALTFAKNEHLRTIIIGGGSNIFFSNLPKALIIKIGLKGIKFNGNEIKVFAGENWDSFVKKTLSKNLYGLENLSGIPGTVGASPVQNIGAYGVEVREYIKEVWIIDKRNLKIRKFSNKECKFDYRDSFFKTEKGKNFVIFKVIFVLNKKEKINIEYKDLIEYFERKNKINALEVRKAVIEIRKEKFPDLKKFGTAGSFFKNPVITVKKYEMLLKKFPGLPSYPAEKGFVKVPLTWILDNICNLKGYRKNSVGLYKNQPLVLVNFDKATEKEVNTLVKQIKKKVFEKTNIKIVLEVTFIK
jgi:UDP-N-acetylmuramate dehydrogenase